VHWHPRPQCPDTHSEWATHQSQANLGKHSMVCLHGLTKTLRVPQQRQCDMAPHPAGRFAGHRLGDRGICALQLALRPRHREAMQGVAPTFAVSIVLSAVHGRSGGCRSQHRDVVLSTRGVTCLTGRALPPSKGKSVNIGAALLSLQRRSRELSASAKSEAQPNDGGLQWLLHGGRLLTRPRAYGAAQPMPALWSSSCARSRTPQEESGLLKAVDTLSGFG
jgi:hypothetical protein